MGTFRDSERGVRRKAEKVSYNHTFIVFNKIPTLKVIE